LAFAFGLAPWAGTLQIAAAATAAAWVAAAVAAPGALGRRVLAAAAATVVALAVCPHCLEGWEQRLAEARWRSFGVLPPGTAGSTGQRTAGPRLLASFDSRYQNLAVVESAGQRTLYGNGQVLFAWPDPLRYEHAVHFVMAQKPGARRVLLLGGNPLGHIPELLRYPLERLDWVELDDGLGRCLRAVDPAAYAAAVADPRVRVLHADGPRHVRACRERYDVVLVLAPEPVTSAANRYYTAGFYRRLRAVLTPDGFVYTTLETSEDLVPETARLAASVQRALASAFGTVLVVGGGPTQFFAGEPASGLTLDSAALAERSRGAGLATRYFRPAYFLHADELSAEKLAFVRERLARADGSANTELEPATYRAGLVRWLRQGGAGAADWLARVGRAGAGRLLAVCVALGLLGAAGFAWAARRGGGRARRSAALLTLAVAGFSGVAVELVLIYAVQGLYGYVYARMGLLVGLFMLGSALGAGTGRRLERASAAGARHGVLGLALVLPALAAALPGLIAAAAAACAPWAAGLAENGVALLVAVAGWAVGALFAGVCRQLRDTGAAAGGAAAAAETADYAGSALGALVTGAVLIPALGLPATCALVALLGACAAGWMLAART
jgi:spermidine synthase